MILGLTRQNGNRWQPQTAKDTFLLPLAEVCTLSEMPPSKERRANKPVLLVAEPPENTKSVGSLLGSIVDL